MFSVLISFLAFSIYYALRHDILLPPPPSCFLSFLEALASVWRRRRKTGIVQVGLLSLFSQAVLLVHTISCLQVFRPAEPDLPLHPTTAVFVAIVVSGCDP